jgi:hypothetical protein
MLHEGLVSLVEHILFALEENVFLSHSKPVIGPNMEPSPHQFGLPTDSTHRHCRKEEDPHLHTRDIEKQSLSVYAQQD